MAMALISLVNPLSREYVRYPTSIARNLIRGDKIKENITYSSVSSVIKFIFGTMRRQVTVD